MPQKRIKDMKVIEKDGRKIVMIGKVGTTRNPVRSPRPLEKSQESTPEEKEETPEKTERQETEAVQTKAPAAPPTPEVAPAFKVAEVS